MMKLTDNQLEMTTKRTIMENEQMSIELSYQSRQTEKLLTRNNVLIEENRHVYETVLGFRVYAEGPYLISPLVHAPCHLLLSRASHS